MPFIGIRIGPLERVQPGVLAISYRHRDYGSGHVFLDESTLTPMEKTIQLIPEYPKQLLRPKIPFEGIGVRLAHDKIETNDAQAKYVLRWETLPANHDRPRTPPLPPPSPLELIKMRPVGE